MGVLSVYDEVIENPTPISREYFATRPKVSGLATWYPMDGMPGYTTYKIPITKKHTRTDKHDSAYFVSVWEDQPIQLATIKFTYDFDSKLLFYDIAKVLSVYEHNLPVNTLILKRDGWKEIGQLLEVDMSDIKPGRFFKNIENIKDFELVIDGTKSILVNAGYYLPEF